MSDLQSEVKMTGLTDYKLIGLCKAGMYGPLVRLKNKKF